MFQNLPRQTFGKLQAKLFPKYFLLCTISILLQVRSCRQSSLVVCILYQYSFEILTLLPIVRPLSFFSYFDTDLYPAQPSIGSDETSHGDSGSRIVLDTFEPLSFGTLFNENHVGAPRSGEYARRSGYGPLQGSQKDLWQNAWNVVIVQSGGALWCRVVWIYSLFSISGRVLEDMKLLLVVARQSLLLTTLARAIRFTQ